jgi:hypothetical protein
MEKRSGAHPSGDPCYGEQSLRGLCAETLIPALVLTAVGPLMQAIAEPPDRQDYLDQVRRMNEVAAQKVEADISGALSEAQTAAQSDRNKAAEILSRALQELDNDTALHPTRRDRLIRLVKARLQAVQAPERRAAAPQQASDPQPAHSQIQNLPTAPGSELSHELAAVRALYRDGRAEEARQRVEELGRRYPDNPAVLAARRNLSAIDTLEKVRQDRKDMERGALSANRDVDHSGTPPAGDIDFPKDWAEKSKKRSSATQLSAKERAIIKALNSPINVDFRGTKFEEVIDTISKAIGQPIAVDRNALEEAQVNYETAVTLKGNGLAVRTILRQLLSRYGLAYVIKEQTIEITSAMKAKETMVVRSYYIGDLLSNLPLGGWAGFFGLPIRNDVNQMQQMQQVSQLIDMIESSIEPTSWQKNGGSGAITFNPATNSLVIKASAEVHAMIGGGITP